MEPDFDRLREMDGEGARDGAICDFFADLEIICIFAG